ncbi:MAG TPA: bifunctional 4-hydroxy-2-oxoglutarate aldolase/2-dehydro-3-deoxy-phosphogluconate aldolase [Nevskia sp.]|nr:bifunctional 4-hydroxy-2-oxoglutarate aldolase/2-dehydro-3-deoxy-phosphogluconate aldolase [Nevskia sp.]
MAMQEKQDRLARLFALAPVIAVVVIDEAKHAVPLTRALLEGGVQGIEITLRTPAALDAIRAIAQELPQAAVGSGTVLTPEDLAASEKAGARFAVSPGCTPRLLAAAADSAVPYLPAAATASEVMVLLERGYRHLKFFPAQAAGGVAMLRAWAGPLPAARFCATGGISPENAPSYLALPNVPCVGGSWLTPASGLAAGDWPAVTELARQACRLRA